MSWFKVQQEGKVVPTSEQPQIPAQMSPAAASIADATIRVIARDGFDEVSVRTVAREAGVAPGTIQHHFHSRDALLRGALQRTIQRQLERFHPQPEGTHPWVRLRRGLGELLPIDDRRREEAIVWVAFSAAASTRDSLRTSHLQALRLTRDLIRGVLAQAAANGQLRPDYSVEVGAFLLTAVIDGLVLDGINAEAADIPVLTAALHHVIDQIVVSPEEGMSH